MINSKLQIEIFRGNLTLPKSVEKCRLERDLNWHLRDTSPPLYLMGYRVHRDWKRVFILQPLSQIGMNNFCSCISEEDPEIKLQTVRWFLVWIDKYGPFVG